MFIQGLVKASACDLWEHINIQIDPYAPLPVRY